MRKDEDIEKDDNIRKKDKDSRIKRQEARWLLPPEGWHKANFDGASKGNPGPSGCGGVIRNCNRDGLVAFSMPLDIQTNHVAKARASCESVKEAYEKGVKNLWLEGDSKDIVDCIKGLTQESWTISNIIEETRDYLSKFEKGHISHVFQEANPMADWLANDGVRQEKKKTWILGKDLPNEAKSIIFQEKILGSTAEIIW